MKTVLLAMFVSVAAFAADKPAPKTAVRADGLQRGVQGTQVPRDRAGGHGRPHRRLRRRRDPIPTSSTSAPPRAACSRRRTAASRGSRSSTISRRRPSATSPSRRRIPSIVWVGTRRGEQPPELVVGQRRLQVDRRRQDLEAHGARRHACTSAASSSHPADPNVVYVAARRQLCGAVEGSRRLQNDRRRQDVEQRPLRQRRHRRHRHRHGSRRARTLLIAAMYQRRRTVFGFSGSGPGGGLYKTTDGGATWKKLEKGLPWDPDAKRRQPPTRSAGREGDRPHRRQLLSPQREHRLRAHRARATAASSAATTAAKRGRSSRDTNPRGSYYSQVASIRTTTSASGCTARSMYISEDGGKTFKHEPRAARSTATTTPCGSIRATPNHMITGSDGGIYVTQDRGRRLGLPQQHRRSASSTRSALDMQKPYRICGGLQDNNVWCGPRATLDTRGIANSRLVHRRRRRRLLRADRSDRSEHRLRRVAGRQPAAPQSEDARVALDPPAGGRGGEPASAFSGTRRSSCRRTTPKTIYYGGNYLFKSTDRGDTWTRLGGDLTTGADRDKLPIMGQRARQEHAVAPRRRAGVAMRSRPSASRRSNRDLL